MHKGIAVLLFSTVALGLQPGGQPAPRQPSTVSDAAALDMAMSKYDEQLAAHKGRFRIEMGTLAAKQTYLLDTETGDTWVLTEVGAERQLVWDPIMRRK